MDEDLASFAVDNAMRYGASYADVRIEDRYEDAITIANRKVEQIIQRRKNGIGIRVLANGVWGFRSTTDFTKTRIRECISTAVDAAKASTKHTATPIKIAMTKTYRGSYSVTRKLDIEDVSLEDKISAMRKWEQNLYVSDDVSVGLLDYFGSKIEKLFLNSEGTCVRSKTMSLIAELRAESSRGGKRQFYDSVVSGSGGFEVLADKDMEKVARETGSKSSQLLKAGRAKPENNVTVIMAPSFLSLLSHEICGHANEGDRVLGQQSAWAGTSWWAGQLGKRIGSEHMNLYDDPTLKGAHSFYLYDDEGTKAGRKILVEKGILRGYLQSRATAAAFGVEPNAGMRAQSYEYVPLIRMSNTFFGAGDYTAEEMIKTVKHGYLLIGSYGREATVDSARYSIRISPHEAYRIENGELTNHICDMTIATVSQTFFESIDAASKDCDIETHIACGKGDPMQIISTGNGGAYIRGVVNVS